MQIEKVYKTSQGYFSNILDAFKVVEPEDVQEVYVLCASVDFGFNEMMFELSPIEVK